MSERVDFSAIKPKIPELNTGALSMPDRDNVSKNPVNNSIFTEQIPQKNSKISLSQEKLLPDNPKLAEYGIDLNKPFAITPTMIKKMKSKGKKGFWESLKDGVKNAIPFVSGALEVKKSVDLIAIARKQERGEKLTKEETEKMYLYLLEQVEAQHRGSSFWGKVGEGLTHMPAFAGEFFLTGGVYSLGKTAATKAVTKLAGEITKEQVKKYIAKNVAEVAVGAAARSLVLSNTYANIAKRRLEIDTAKLKDGTGELSLKESKESLGESIGKGMLDGYIESVSEQSGAGFNYVLSKPLAKLPLGKFLVPSGKTKEFMAKTGFNGILEEFAEERFGGFLRGATKLENDENKSYLENVFWSTLPPTWEDAGVEVMTTTLWGGGMSATHRGINKFVERKYQEAMEDIEDMAQLSEDALSQLATTESVEALAATPMVVKTTEPQQIEETFFESPPVAFSGFSSQDKNLKFNISKEKIKQIKSFFLDGKMNVENPFYKELKKLQRMNFEDKKHDKKSQIQIINLNPKLTKKDCYIINEILEKFNGKYKKLLLERNNHGVRNIENLALFVRSIILGHEVYYYLKFQEIIWDKVIKDILEIPNEAIPSLLSYKKDSRLINTALSERKTLANEEKKHVEYITRAIRSFYLEHPLALYRADGGFGLFENVKLNNNETLSSVLQKYTEIFLEKAYDKHNKNYYLELPQNLYLEIIGTVIKQPRFLSTTLRIEGTSNFKKQVMWKILTPKNFPAISIEQFNTQRPHYEMEFLLQRDTMLIINDIKFDIMNKCWRILATAGIKDVDSLKKNVNMKMEVKNETPKN